MFRSDVLCDATFVIAGKGQLTIEGVGLTFAVTGGTGKFKKARGQLHETFLPSGEFRFALPSISRASGSGLRAAARSQEVHTMHGTTAVPSAAAASAIRNGATLMAVAAAGFIGYALLFLVRNFTGSFLELGIGPAEVNVGKDQIQQFSPSLYHYISHLHLAVSGFIAATGLAVLLLAVHGVRAGQAWAWVAAVAAPVLGLAVALPAHYPWNLDTLGHLGLVYLAGLVFVAGAALSGKGLLDARRTTGSL
jgi:hypothetical protein